MAAMKISLAAAMRARDVSRPHAGHEADAQVVERPPAPTRGAPPGRATGGTAGSPPDGTASSAPRSAAGGIRRDDRPKPAARAGQKTAGGAGPEQPAQPSAPQPSAPQPSAPQPSAPGPSGAREGARRHRPRRRKGR
jgi:hypothetical protein